MQFLGDLLDHATNINDKLIYLILAIGWAITHFKQSKTGGAVEDAKQASAKVYIEQLLETRKLLVDERAAWAIERAELRGVQQRQHEQHEAEREDWRKANREIGDRFEQALVQFRDALATSDHDRGVLIEDIAELRGQVSGLQGEKLDLQAAIQRRAGEDAEARRVLLSMKEREIGSLKVELEKAVRVVEQQRVLITDQARTLRDNGLDPNITGIIDAGNGT